MNRQGKLGEDLRQRGRAREIPRDDVVPDIQSREARERDKKLQLVQSEEGEVDIPRLGLDQRRRELQKPRKMMKPKRELAEKRNDTPTVPNGVDIVRADFQKRARATSHATPRNDRWSTKVRENFDVWRKDRKSLKNLTERPGRERQVTESSQKWAARTGSAAERRRRCSR
jgi:hypothetical protein